MIKYFAYYPHEFHNDPRVNQLTTKQQQQFLFLISKMSQMCATIPENYKEIGRLLDMSTINAKSLIIRLKGLGLLVASGTGSQIFSLHSPRLLKEYLKSKDACEKAISIGKARINKRWHPDDLVKNNE